MIDYYFETGEFCKEEDVDHIPKCNMCDNCTNENKPVFSDITNESVTITNIIKTNCNRNRYALGLKKTVDLIRKQSSLSSPLVKSIIEILITRNVLERRKAGYGFAIGVGKTKLNDIIPIKARINDVKMKVTLKTSNIANVMELRNQLAKKHNLVPANFINDMVIRNIHAKSPKTLGDLWTVDGISNEFIMTKQCVEFMKGYVDLSGKPPQKKKTNKKNNNRDNVYRMYKDGKSVADIAMTLGISENTIESHILFIFEHNDGVDVDVEYLGLTEEKEETIMAAIKKVGSEYLKPIKENVGNDITYTQIKLCLLVVKIESA